MPGVSANTSLPYPPAFDPSCADGTAKAPDICRPRVRRRLLVVGPPRSADAEADVVAAAAKRLGTPLAAVADELDALEYMARHRVSCVILDRGAQGGDVLGPVGRFGAAHPDLPVVVIGHEAEPELAAAVVQAGAQDYLPAPELDASRLERAIRHGIDRQRTRSQLRHFALHDQLTGVPNRTLFAERLGEALARPGGVAVLFVDVDDFKRLNDNLGHSGGDAALRATARRLLDVVRPGDTVARFGGDEFTILCENVVDDAAALDVASRIVEVIAKPLVIEGAELVLRASVGVATDLCGGAEPDRLLRDADEAMYAAKHLGGGRAKLFAARRRQTGNALALEADLRHALADDALRLAYQPQMRLSDGAVIGAEALLRWTHPHRGPVGPCDFIPIAEQSGLIVPIGRWVLSEACAEAARFEQSAGLPLRISVNVSGRQILDPALAADVEAAIEQSGIAPEQLQVELTESVLIDDLDDSLALVGRLKELGVSVALDDFGTGYSSLSYLKQLPVDMIKVDRAFVAGLPDSREDLAIVSAVVSFADALGLSVIAEGVETEDHVQALRDIGCELAQGFHFHRPLEAVDMHDLLRGGQRLAGDRLPT